MKRSSTLWVLAFILTILIAVYQRLTGPTYPIKGNIEFQNSLVEYYFARSHGGLTDHEVTVNTNNSELIGYLFYKRYKTEDSWTKIRMTNLEGKLRALLPHQPPAGKLEYYVKLVNNASEIKLPADHSIVIRYKGDVPLIILIPHVIAMFLSMLLSNRTGLEFFNNGKNLLKLTYWTIIALLIGGFILGPLTQLYAFGELWTGFPFGYDLTDNKTLLALIGWLIALYMYKKSKNPTRWAFFASLLLIIVYLIPHSMMGSELDYNKLDKQKTKFESLKK